jgi:hypothetical protein
MFQTNKYLAFQKEIEKEFERSIKEVFNDKTINRNDLILGMSVQAAIAYTRESLQYEADFKTTDLDEKVSYYSIIDEITKKMLHKYLENY